MLLIVIPSALLTSDFLLCNRVSLFFIDVTIRDVYLYAGGRIPQRWIFAIMGFLALFNAYAMRVCLSITITEMVIQTHDEDSSGYVTKTSNVKQYNWDGITQVTI